MSRPVAGVRNKTLIITLPGSPTGASENLEAILVLLPHACEQAAGADSRALHQGGVKRLESQSGIISKQPSMASGISSSQPLMSGALQPTHKHSHKHSHSHSHSRGHSSHSIPVARTKPEDRPTTNDPKAGPVNRYRESPYPTLSVDDALKIILDKVPAPEKVLMPTNTSIVGNVLAEDVRANEAVPAFRASIVDGYAVVIPESEASVEGRFPVVSVSHAAPGRIPALREGQVARITTGAPLPPGATAVVMVEDTRIVSTTDDGKEEKVVEILTDETVADENVREVGSDIQLNEVILKANEEITSVGGEIGLLASVGRSSVNVYRKPTIGVLSTGDEIIPHTRPKSLQLGEVRDCNRPTLMAAVSGWGYEAVDLGIAKDTCVLPLFSPTCTCAFSPPPPSLSLSLLLHMANSSNRARKLQTRSARSRPPLGPALGRRHHHLGRRLDGRAGPAETDARAQPGRDDPLRARRHEARQTDHLRHRAVQILARGDEARAGVQPAGQPGERAGDGEPVRAAGAAEDGREAGALGLAAHEGRRRCGGQVR